MTSLIYILGACALLLATGPAPAADTTCAAASGPTRASLLELYTSEGCSSCPPAEHWLSGLRGRLPRGLVPLAFHVDYWDGLDWVDHYARPAYAERQRRIAAIHQSRTIYTPQFVLDGEDWRPRGTPPESRELAGAELRLELGAAANARLEVGGEARMRGHPTGAQLYLALYENNLTSRVAAGENAGSLLKHDFVVRRLAGPFPIPASGTLPIHHIFALEPDWKPEDLGISVFVQNAASGEVYQALRLGVCAGGV
jgi:hypothetical protein